MAQLTIALNDTFTRDEQFAMGLSNINGTSVKIGDMEIDDGVALDAKTFRYLIVYNKKKFYHFDILVNNYALITEI